MEKKICKDCMYYVNHYVKEGEEFVSLERGHCRYLTKWRNRKATATACYWYQEIKTPEN